MIGSSGLDNLVWFMGLVEDNNDPLSGRVRVRAFGFHPPYSDGLVGTEDLPWAHVVRDGKFVSVPDNGDMAIGFFMDGKDAQHPVVIGVINSAKFSLPTTSNPYGPPTASTGTSTGGKPVRVGQAVNKELEPHQRAFLDAIASKESGGAYNIRYDGGAGSTFDLSTGQHPNIRVPLPGGNYSTAAGRYQFTKSTWDEVSGGAAFTPENQDYYAWKLAEQRYPGDLNEYLKNNGADSNVLSALAPTWAAFGVTKSHADIIATYNDSMSKSGESGEVDSAPFENEFMAPTQDSMDNFGNSAMPPQISGENVENTPALVQSVARKDVMVVGYSVSEPSVPLSASTKSSVWNTRHGGSFIELSGKTAEEEYVNITHVSGSRVTMDANGNIAIKAFGKLHVSSEGVIEEVSEGPKMASHSGGYALAISGGSADIIVSGDLNIGATGNISIKAGGKFAVSAGDAIDMSGSRVAITAKADAIDIAAAGKMALSSAANGMSLNSGEAMYIQSYDNMNIKSTGGDVGIAATGGDLGLLSSGKMNMKGTPINLNTEGEERADVPDSLDTITANTEDPLDLGVSTPTKPIPTPTGIGPDMLDESSNIGATVTT